MSSRPSGFHDFSENVVLGSVRCFSLMMEAKDEVTTTRFTDGAERFSALRMPVVPITAGSISSVLGSSKTQSTTLASFFRAI